MTYLICIDDTDMPGTKGTGWLVQELCKLLEQNKMADSTSPISRHQLFVHEDIPFTSHNSAMCFEMALQNNDIFQVIDFMAAFLEERSQKGSDPGLCVAGLDQNLDRERLIKFGKNAKKAVSSKEAAYDLAKETGIHLSEHGGTGQGVVGAVAGIGLRLSGNDGRYRGWYHLGMPGDVVRVDRLCQYPFIDQLVTPQGKSLPLDALVCIGSEKTKTVRLKERQVLVAVENENVKSSGISYRTITKEEAKQY
ncbi:MAG: hypothetical protein GY729_02545 [Desulfobacteraceae bacterium]|nr:hypothetical protein [Desulfobacteraceae bacterium]